MEAKNNRYERRLYLAIQSLLSAISTTIQLELLLCLGRHGIQNKLQTNPRKKVGVELNMDMHIPILKPHILVNNNILLNTPHDDHSHNTILPRLHKLLNLNN
jgi:hypothetical protein